MNPNSNMASNSSFNTKPNTLFAQTSTCFFAAVKNNFQSHSIDQENHHVFTRPSQSSHISNQTPSSSVRNFHLGPITRHSSSIVPKNPEFAPFANPAQNISQTTNFILEKLKSDPNALMDVEVSDFTFESLKTDNLLDQVDASSHFDALIENIELPQKSSNETLNKVITKERYAQPKRKNPTLIK